MNFKSKAEVITRTKTFFSGLILLLAMISAGETKACGSVDIWHSNYFKAESQKDNLDALMFLHCDPVVDGYRNDSAETAKLVELLTDALHRADSLGSNQIETATFMRNLVLKNYVRFKLYETPYTQQTPLLNKLSQVWGVETALLLQMLRELKDDHPLRRSEGMGSPQSSYAQQLAREVRM